MSDYITASFDKLHQQSTMAAADNLNSAKREIDKTFGDGYAAKNPVLVSAFIAAAAADMSAATNAKVTGAALQRIAQSLSAIADSLAHQ
jgi:hypothetical protein